MRKFMLASVLAFMTAAPLPAMQDSVSVRVFSKYAMDMVSVWPKQNPDAAVTLVSDAGRLSIDKEPVDEGSGRAVLFGGRYGIYTVSYKDVKRDFSGAITASLDEKGRIKLIFDTDLEHYVGGVLAGEIDDVKFTPESAASLSVLIRTFAVKNHLRHGDYDMCDLSHCQVYKGCGNKPRLWNSIVSETGGYILEDRINPGTNISFFSICCGGETETPESFWGVKDTGAIVKDEINGKKLCGFYHYYSWVKEVKTDEIETVLNDDLKHNGFKVDKMEITAKTPAGRARELTFISAGGQRAVVPAEKFFSAFGKRYHWARVPSYLFTVKKEGDKLIFTGKGHGHGIGMCMAGAFTMAKMGYNWQEILFFYFPGAVLKKI